MDNIDINNRLKIIEELDAYLAEKNKLILDTIENLGWSKESLLDETKVQCPLNPDHWVHESSLSSHIERCSWVKEGYLKEDLKKQPPSSKGFYQNSSIVPVTIDKELQAKILIEKGLKKSNPMEVVPDLPKTIDRWTVELTAEQRLAVYDYVVKESKSCNKPKNVTLEDLMFDFEKKNDDDRPKTEAEILAEQRDYKRRRQSYRAKNVHITKKSYTEVIKEVIENQTMFLAETSKPDNDRSEETSIPEEPTRVNEESDKDSSHYRRSSKKKRKSVDKDDTDYHRYLKKNNDESYDVDDSDYRRYLKKNNDESYDEDDADFREYSHQNRSKSPKAKKRKHKRSRSRSRSRHHKKSHKHKHKKSRD